VGYTYSDSYICYFGPDYSPPEYIRREYQAARQHGSPVAHMWRTVIWPNNFL